MMTFVRHTSRTQDAPFSHNT